MNSSTIKSLKIDQSQWSTFGQLGKLAQFAGCKDFRITSIIYEMFSYLFDSKESQNMKM